MEKIYLVQTDTIAGLVCANKDRLNKIKGSKSNKKLLMNVSSFKELKSITRVPNMFKNIIRRAKKTTFIYPNSKAIRVVNSGAYYEFLKNFKSLYSTSANKSGGDFDFKWADLVSDVTIYNGDFTDKEPSKIIKLNQKKLKK